MKNIMTCPQKLKNRNTMWSSNPISVYLYTKEMKSLCWDICTPMFSAALISHHNQGLNCHSVDEWEKTMWYIIRSFKKRKFSHLWQHEWTWEVLHYKPDGGRQILCSITYMWNVKKPKKQKTHFVETK